MIPSKDMIESARTEENAALRAESHATFQAIKKGFADAIEVHGNRVLLDLERNSITIYVTIHEDPARVFPLVQELIDRENPDICFVYTRTLGKTYSIRFYVPQPGESFPSVAKRTGLLSL